MSVQGDTELRDLVSQTLENAGVLAKIRAELRASVFLVLEEHEAFKGRNLSFTNKPLRDFLSTEEGIIIVNLVREFLEYFGLEFTASVFEPETQAGKDYEYAGRNKLAHDLKLNTGKKAPLIAQVLQESKICFPTTASTQKDESHDNTLKKDKLKDNKKIQETSNHTQKSETTSVQTNGIIRSHENHSKEPLNNENKPPLLANSPPSFQNHLKKPDSLKLDLNQLNIKPAGSSLSSLGGLPPLGLPPVGLPPLSVSQNNQMNKITIDRGSKQMSSDIKALLDFGSGNDSPENNYEEDFQPSGSEKTSKGTNRSLSGSGSEVEEEMSVGIDDQSSSSNSGKTSEGL